MKDIKTLFLFWNYFGRMKFDAVHTVTPKAGLLGVFAARLANTNNRVHVFTGQVWHTKTGAFRKLLKIISMIGYGKNQCLLEWQQVLLCQ